MSPGRQLPSSICRQTLICAVLLSPSLLWADKVYLKSGDVVSGTIIEETPDMVRVQVLVGTIKDKRAINRVSIDRIEKTTPEDVEREACLPLKTTPDGLPAKGYEERLKVIDEFLAKYPSSKYRAEIQGIRDSLDGELKRIKSGELRFRGTWLTPEQQTIHAPNLEAATALRLMRQAAAGRNLLGALRQLEMIEKAYPGTLALPVAITDAKSLLPAYGQRLTQELEYAKYDTTQNAKGMASLTGAARDAAQQELDAAAARFKAQIEAEKAKKITWLTVDLKSEASINEAIARVRKEIDRVGKLDPAALDAQAKAFYDAGELVYAGKLDEAKTALTAAANMNGGAKFSQAKAKTTPSTKKSSATTSAAPPERPTILAHLQQQLDDRVQKMANQAKLAEMEAAKKAANDPASPSETPAGSGDDALDALVMQRTASSATEKGNAEDSAKPAKGSKAERKTAAAKRSNSAAATTDESGEIEKPKPVRALPPQKASSPLPMIVGVVAVCLVGVTVFLFIQEKKKQQGDS
jgi:hypothetical protein